RYARHLTLPEVGTAGQEKLRAARVLCVGAGGLGSPLALYLAAAGIGTLGMVDFDAVDESNLHRQILYGTKDVGRPKLQSAAERIFDVNPHVAFVPFEERLTSRNALAIIGGFDIVADGTDNFPTRYLINDACVMTGRPNVYASIFRFEGQASVFAAPGGPCYRCLYPEPPPAGVVPSCAEGGVLGILPGLLGTIQATEVLKLVLGIGSPLIGKLLLVDALAMKFRELRLRKSADCVVCGPNPSVRELIDYEAFCGVGGPVERIPSITAEELKRKVDRGDPVVILDVREPDEVAAARIPGSRNIPLGSLSESLEKISKADEIVVHCRSGSRSSRAVRMLLDHGYPNVRNLEGGIRRWAEKVDPGIRVS
ncbi:MAG: molybdopterin-synthase adenylyltransferase MoeB, partial [Thermoanaerobaculia bacterium]